MTITAAEASLSLDVAASRASPGSQPWLVDLRASDPLRLGRTRAPKEDGSCRPLAGWLEMACSKAACRTGSRPGQASRA